MPSWRLVFFTRGHHHDEVAADLPVAIFERSGRLDQAGKLSVPAPPDVSFAVADFREGVLDALQRRDLIFLVEGGKDRQEC